MYSFVHALQSGMNWNNYEPFEIGVYFGRPPKGPMSKGNFRNGCPTVLDANRDNLKTCPLCIAPAGIKIVFVSPLSPRPRLPKFVTTNCSSFEKTRPQQITILTERRAYTHTHTPKGKGKKCKTQKKWTSTPLEKNNSQQVKALVFQPGRVCPAFDGAGRKI